MDTLVKALEYWFWREQRNGVTLNELTDLTGVPRPQINRMIQRYKYNQGEVIITRPQLLELYICQEMSIKRIAHKYFCSTHAVWNHLRKYDIPVRSKGNPDFKKLCREHSDG